MAKVSVSATNEVSKPGTDDDDGGLFAYPIDPTKRSEPEKDFAVIRSVKE
jgi:hypothetical protein